MWSASPRPAKPIAPTPHGAINTLGVLRGVDITRGGRPIYLGLETQALSAIAGPELNPIALKYTAILSKTVDLPLISGGGVMTWQHIVERLMLGARCEHLLHRLREWFAGCFRLCGGPGRLTELVWLLRLPRDQRVCPGIFRRRQRSSPARAEGIHR